MELGYVIAYVPDVEASIAFYERAFGLTRRFVAPDGTYGELQTGSTTLAFAAHGMVEANDLGTLTLPDPAAPALGIEIALVDPDVAGAFDRSVAAGAVPVSEPKETPWGQTVAYVRDLAGILIELASPMEGA